MPGAFLKGNSLFHGARFEVDELNSPWNVYGILPIQFDTETAHFIRSSTLLINYFKLRNVICLHITGSIRPSTVPYTGVEGDTSYLYMGNSVSFDSPVFNTLKIDLEATLASSRNVFSSVVNITDTKDAVYYNPTRDPSMGIVSIDGHVNATRLTISNPLNGYIPHHEYRIDGTLFYETR